MPDSQSHNSNAAEVQPPKFSGEKIAAAEAQIFEQSKRIEFYLTEYSVEYLASKMRDGDFQIPVYQREDTWEPQRKSRFIESLFNGASDPIFVLLGKPLDRET